MMDHPRVSIIVPCKSIDGYTLECVEHCKELDYENYEIIVLPDESEERIKNVRIIPTGTVSPGKKRNVGIANSKADFCAFIDSDAYPRKDWLKNAIGYFHNQDIAAVGGPGITPDNASDMEKASGYILSSFLVAGRLSSRYSISHVIDSDDIHSCNFIVKKSIIQEVGGWNEEYWPGEDTLMCLSIKKTNKKMIEAPDVVVYHHRRPLFGPHLKQVSNFGLHRGFFAKKFPQTSLRLVYFFPSTLLLIFLLSVLSCLYAQLRFFSYLLAIYVFLAFLAAVMSRDIRVIPQIWLGIILTHVAYGTFFLIGLTKREL